MDAPVENYYPVTDIHPPLDVVVKVVWGSWQGFGARIPAHNSGKRWVQVRPGEHSIIRWRRTLKPGAKYTRSPGTGCDIAMVWAPLDATTWRADLPDPVPAANPFALAAQSKDKVGRQGQRKRWWLNPAEVTRSKEGNISLREAEGRVMRALASEDASRIVEGLGMHRLKYLRSEPEQNSGYELPFIQNGADIDDFVLAMSWYSGLLLENLEAAALLGAAADRDDSWDRLARRFSTSTYKLKKLYNVGIETIWRSSNGEETPGMRARRQNVEQLRKKRASSG